MPMREFDLLRHVYTANPALGAAVRIPPGDDMAMIDLGGSPAGVGGIGRPGGTGGAGAGVLAAVDQVVAGRHVDLASAPLELVGRKAMTRSLSDIAAMAARPLASLVAATLPPDFGEDRATHLFDAMRDTAAHYRCPLIGGDIAFHSQPAHPLTISVTVLAVPVDGRPPVERRGAQAGDALYVTGRLGGSLQPGGGGRHLTFEPRIDAALVLHEALGDRLHAMIDLSDGLGRDAGHLAEASGVTIRLDAGHIPCTRGFTWREAVTHGEDYELCFAATGDVPDTVDAVPVTRVGVVEPPPPGSDWAVLIRAGDETIDAREMGWEHGSA